MVDSTSVPGSAPSERVPNLRGMATCPSNWDESPTEGLKQSSYKLSISVMSSCEANDFNFCEDMGESDSVVGVVREQVTQKAILTYWTSSWQSVLR
jgi:hypothetical protein